MTTSDSRGGLSAEEIDAERVELGREAAILPDLFHAERRLEQTHERLRGLHYALCCYMVQRGFNAADDLALTAESGDTLRELDLLRDDLRAIRRRLSLGERQ